MPHSRVGHPGRAGIAELPVAYPQPAIALDDVPIPGRFPLPLQDVGLFGLQRTNGDQVDFACNRAYDQRVHVAVVVDRNAVDPGFAEEVGVEGRHLHRAALHPLREAIRTDAHELRRPVGMGGQRLFARVLIRGREQVAGQWHQDVPPHVIGEYVDLFPRHDQGLRIGRGDLIDRAKNGCATGKQLAIHSELEAERKVLSR